MSIASGFEALLIDLDGTVYEAGELIPGAAETTAWLRRRGIPFLFTTNTSRMSRRAVVRSLRNLGLRVEQGEILTANVAAARWLSENRCALLQLLVPEAALEDFAAFEVVEEGPDAVLLADFAHGFTFEALNRAFRSVLAGARLVAIHKNRFWIPDDRPSLDAGPFVAALEFATRREAVLVGKPSPAFFDMAAGMLGVSRSGLAVIGDDAESDVRGGNAAGLTTVRVRTGKFRVAEHVEVSPEETPDLLIDSIRDIPALLTAG